jgi:protein tyrosine phosphatase
MVTQLHVMNWVDNDVVDPRILLDLACRMMQFTKTLSTEERHSFAPVVHCSMGVGRSSAVVLAYSFLFTVLKKDNALTNYDWKKLKTEIDSYISHLRRYRGCFVPDCQFTLLALETIRILLGYKYPIDLKLKAITIEKTR